LHQALDNRLQARQIIALVIGDRDPPDPVHPFNGSGR
jgi:hypothetical protein